METNQSTSKKPKLNLDFKDSKYATGRRKTSIAKVWLKKGTGKIYVNGKLFNEYFVSENHKMQITRPFEIINQDLSEYDEGCLSVPGFYETVSRPESILVRAQDRTGEIIELEAEGILSTCIQHEIDHLDGKLFVDYLSTLKRNRIRNKLEKEQRKSL